jgi:serine/threonine protein kinase
MKQLAQNGLVQNRYLVVHPIGKGGMGEVYLAVDQRLGSAVALKRTRFESESELGKAFEREAKILARLRHPVLPKVIDHFTEGDGQFLVMEHISGDDLAKRLETSGKPFPVSWVMFWADQLLDGLNYLHSHEPPIIHRDIKPQNLKLSENNHIVLLDFGLSKDYESVNTGGSSGVGSIVGYSPGFAPMEQIRGTGTDARSDLYSLGATLYQLLSNRSPQDALTRADDLLGGKPDPLTSLTELNPEVTPAISEAVLRSMSVRQDERFETAAEMQKVMRRAYNQAKEPPVALTSIPDTAAATETLPRTAISVDTASSTANDTTPGIDAAAMDATLRMAPSELETVVRQSDIKTELFKAPVELPAEAPVGESVPEPQAESTPASAEPSPSNGVPLQKVEPPKPAAPVVPPPPSQQKSRAGLYIGIFVILFVVGGLAAGGGWYAYTRYQAAAPPAATPTPEVVAAPSAPPANTVQTESTPDLTQDTSDQNTANTATDTQTVSGPGSKKTNTPASRDVPAKTNPGTAAKPPTKTKGKDDRTVILQ